MSELGGVFGRLHPLVLHLPIGLLAALALVELAGISGRLAIDRRVLGLLCAFNALAAVLAATTGWVLSRSGEYDGDVVDLHQNLGIAVAAASVLCALAHAASRAGARTGWLKVYRVSLFSALALLLPAGHYGATLTHGADFLFGPPGKSEPPAEDPPPPQQVSTPAPSEQPASEQGAASAVLTFASAIQPILTERCTSCHGESKRKGKLALHDAASIQEGGVSGPVILAGSPEQSELTLRIHFPLEHEDHMPPEGKPQLSDEELALIEAWIAAGAPFEGTFEPKAAPADAPEEPKAPQDAAPLAGPTSVAPQPPAAEPAPKPQRSVLAPPPEPSAEALAALTAARVHVELLEPGSTRIAVEFSALGPDADDALAARLLAPVADNVAALSLARTQAGAQSLALAARMPRLERLDLRDTPVDDAALEALRGHEALEELVLVRAKLSDASVDTLLDLAWLRRVYLWQSGVGAEGLARLAAARPELLVESGDTPDSAVLQVEPELALTSDRPVPGAGSGSAALAASNSVCPVSGSPVNPKYRVVWGSQVIGFCCPECPKAFWADPESFLVKLR